MLGRPPEHLDDAAPDQVEGLARFTLSNDAAAGRQPQRLKRRGDRVQLGLVQAGEEGNALQEADELGSLSASPPDCCATPGQVGEHPGVEHLSAIPGQRIAGSIQRPLDKRAASASRGFVQQAHAFVDGSLRHERDALEPERNDF